MSRSGRDHARRHSLPSLMWPFAQHCARARNIGDLQDLLQVEMARLGFRYFCCCSHVSPDRPSPPVLYLHNYPKDWVEHYHRAELYKRDPVFVIAGALSQPFAWEDPRFRALLEADQAEILDVAASHGLKHGVTIPLHGRERSPASCSLIADTPHIDHARVFAAQPYALYAYESAYALADVEPGRPRIVLPRRERECLKLVALGKDDETIAMILGIQRDTVRTYIESAKQKLGVTKRAHAVAYAIYAQAIRLEDLFGR